MKKTLLLLLLHTLLFGVDYRTLKPDAWSATTVSDALKALYDTNITQPDLKRITLKAPKVASNGGSIPLLVKTTIPAKSIAILNDSNSQSLISVFSLSKENQSYPLAMKIRMAQSGTIWAVVEGLDGKLYAQTFYLEVALGGCDSSSGVSTTKRAPMPATHAPQYHAPTVHRSPQNLPTPRVEREEYTSFRENNFKEVASSPLSTFSIDVDTASYANMRSYILDRKALPPKDAVRIEEMINYFDYDYQAPTNDDPFAIHSRIGASIWNPKSHILQVALQTKTVDIDALPSSNLVFLLDVSGSMNRPESLPLLVKSLKLLTRELKKSDRVSIVVYAGASGVILDRARGNEKQKIYQALNSLWAGGGTAGSQGIETAYAIAQKAFIQGGNNRIILATDGDFNIGISNHDDLIKLIEKKRKSGIFLSVLGFGRGNMRDQTMEQLANHGNGNYAYIDTLLEAKKVLVKQMSGTLYTVAKDVKIQIEFNPHQIHAYRLIGYENRIMANEDFNNDKKDAGEIGMGHRVTALYEVILQQEGLKGAVDALKYQKVNATTHSQEFATVKVRYKKPDENQSIRMSHVVKEEEQSIGNEDFYFAQSVAGFGMLLRHSEHKKDLTYDQIIKYAKSAKGSDHEGYRAEFIRIVETAELLNP
jgi:Ca-activated chloride channel family protein